MRTPLAGTSFGPISAILPSWTSTRNALHLRAGDRVDVGVADEERSSAAPTRRAHNPAESRTTFIDRLSSASAAAACGCGCCLLLFLDQLLLLRLLRGAAADFLVAIEVHLAVDQHLLHLGVVGERDTCRRSPGRRPCPRRSSRRDCRCRAAWRGSSVTIASASVSLTPPYFMALPASLFRWRISSASSLFRLTTTPFFVMMAALYGMASNASTL